MHIPDGFLDTKTWVTAAAASGAVLAYAVRKANAEMEEKDAPLMGVTAAFIFAAQMLNFPVAGGTSGHFIGGALAAILLGPWKAMLTMLSVVTVQALLFGDGGVSTLGANTLNMAIIAPFVAHAMYAVLRRFGASIGAFAAGLVSTMVTALACAVELAASGTAPLLLTTALMGGWHLLIGVGEGVITATTVGFLLKVRPDMVQGRGGVDWRSLTALAGVAVFCALLVSPLASSLPDGLERVAHSVGFSDRAFGLYRALIPDYAVPGFRSEGLATGLAGLVGVVLAVATGFGIAALTRRRPTREHKVK